MDEPLPEHSKGPVNPGMGNCGAAVASGSSVDYIITSDQEPKPMLHVQFTASYSALDWHWEQTANVEIHIGNLVSIYAQTGLGFMANIPGGLVDGFDPDFTNDPADGDVSWEGDVPVDQGSDLEVGWNSSLTATSQGDFDPGETADTTKMNWTLRLSLLPAP